MRLMSLHVYIIYDHAFIYFGERYDLCPMLVWFREELWRSHTREGHSSKRNQRHGKISNIPLILEILVPHALDKEWWHWHCIYIDIYLIIFFSVNDVFYNLLLLSWYWISRYNSLYVFSPLFCCCGSFALREYIQSSTGVTVWVRGWNGCLFSFYHWDLENSLWCVALGMRCHSLFVLCFPYVGVFVVDTYMSKLMFEYLWNLLSLCRNAWACFISSIHIDLRTLDVIHSLVETLDSVLHTFSIVWCEIK